MKVVLSHGRGLNQYSKDMVYLARVAKRFGHEVHLVNDIDTDDPAERLARLSALIEAWQEPVILAGFSMGGYCSVAVASQYQAWVKGLFLIAPALYLAHYPQIAYSATCPTLLIHGMKDTVVLPESSMRYANEHRAQLVLVPAGHLFKTTEEVQLLAQYFEYFLQQLETSPNIFGV
ncbi:MAG: alpha/beta hydrolase [Cardiobacteriaceae bacterium]|nr:alpha/beta hydrolase [Cardiobacteriaceae bacterium]